MNRRSDQSESTSGARRRALGVRRPAESWIEEELDFHLEQRSRTIVIESSSSKQTAEDDPKVASKRSSLSGASSTTLPSMPTSTKDLVEISALQIDRAAAIAADKAKDVGTKSADVARVSAEKVNEKRRAGLPPGRDHERRGRRRAAPGDSGRRPRRKAIDRVGPRPDRIVLWAVILGFVLILIAATSSSRAATPRYKLGDRELRVGMVGYDVRALHGKLRTYGFYKTRIKSKYTKTTRTSVRRYQKSRCLQADGVAGKKTIKALRAAMPSCLATPNLVAAPAGPELGYRVLSGGETGDDVRVLQKLLNAAQTSVFDDATVAAVKSFQASAGIAADGVAGPVTLNALGNSQGAYRSTWYGPGFFGNVTACGQTLTETTIGVAHRELPCGTEVILFYNGKYKRATVIDRGPFTDGLVFDLTQATASAIGLVATDNVRAKF